MMCEKKSINRRRLGLLSSPVVLIRLGSVLFVGLMIGHMSAYPWTSIHTNFCAHFVHTPCGMCAFVHISGLQVVETL